jgi:hypothetical protein
MKILRNKGKVVFIATGATNPHDNCPRLIVNEGSNEIRDDYKGSIKISKKILSKIF